MSAASDPLPPPGSPIASTSPAMLYAEPAALEPLLVPVDVRQLRALPPPPPRTAVVPAVRFGVTVAAMGGMILLVALFLTPWLNVRDIAVPQQQSPSQGNGGGVSTAGSTATTNGNAVFALRFIQRDMHELGLAGWASTRREARAAAIVTLALTAQAFALMSMVSAYRWRLFVSLAGLTALATPALAFLDLARIDDLVRHRVATVSTGTSYAGIHAVHQTPGLGMDALFLGAAVVALGALIALTGGRRSQILARMPH